MAQHWLYLCVVTVALNACMDADAETNAAHVGFLRAETPEPLFNSFRDGMRDLGYVEGRNLVIEQRWANGNYAELPRLARELVDLNVDVIFASCTPCTDAVLRASKTIPIVTVSGDPLRMGFVSSLSRPGGSVTGLTLTLDEISLKRLELLKEAAPSVSKVAVLVTRINPIWEGIIDRMKPVARTLGVSIKPVTPAEPAQIVGALEAISSSRGQALYVFEDPVLRDKSPQIIAFAAKRGIPAIYGGTEFVRQGGLISYGASLDDLFRKAAAYVVQILGGAKPGELPMQQPTKYELAVNLKTAKALGLKIPESILLRATEVVQ